MRLLQHNNCFTLGPGLLQNRIASMRALALRFSLSLLMRSIGQDWQVLEGVVEQQFAKHVEPWVVHRYEVLVIQKVEHGNANRGAGFSWQPRVP